MLNSSPGLLGNSGKGKVFVVSAPAGTGKTTLVRMLVEEFPVVVQSLSYTTRAPREDESDGVDYRFIARTAFEKKIEEGEFLEYAEIYGNLYGTSQKWVEERLDQGKYVILVIDTQGALELKKRYPATYIFLLPPTMQELRRRLLHRRTESDEVIEKRLSWAQKEIKKSDAYDYRLVNDDLDTAYLVLKSIVIAEDHKVHEIKGV